VAEAPVELVVLIANEAFVEQPDLSEDLSPKAAERHGVSRALVSAHTEPRPADAEAAR
jgi:hypothetical protein